jgi:hypothetical protein
MATDHISLTEIDRSVKGLFGNLCWNVHWMRATNLSMEFGQPRIWVIHQPKRDIRIAKHSRGVSIKAIRRRLNRRQVAVKGQWSLWIYLAHWRILRSGMILASSSSSLQKISPALLDLQGQRLVRAAVSRDNGATRFEFDLDTVLEVRRRNRFTPDELWLLYGRDGYVRSMRGNGTFLREACDLSSEQDTVAKKT